MGWIRQCGRSLSDGGEEQREEKGGHLYPEGLVIVKLHRFGREQEEA